VAAALKGLKINIIERELRERERERISSDLGEGGGNTNLPRILCSTAAMPTEKRR